MPLDAQQGGTAALSHHPGRPPVPYSPTARSTESRTALLVAARRLFSTVGYPGTSVSDIVGEAGTSVGLLYYHFGSKANVFLTIWTDYQRRQQERTTAAVYEARRAGRSGPEQYLAGVRSYLEGSWADRDIVPMLHGPALPAGFGETVGHGARRWSRRAAGLLPGYDPVTIGHAILMLNEGLSGACLDLATCADEEAATRSIEAVVHLVRSLMDCLPAPS